MIGEHLDVLSDVLYYKKDQRLKVGYVFFPKRFRKLSRAQYQYKLIANQQ